MDGSTQAGLVWLLGGLLLGWLGSWLFERNYRRGEVVDDVAQHPILADHLGNEIARLDGLLAERAAEADRLRRSVELLDQQVMSLNLARTGIGKPGGEALLGGSGN